MQRLRKKRRRRRRSRKRRSRRRRKRREGERGQERGGETGREREEEKENRRKNWIKRRRRKTSRRRRNWIRRTKNWITAVILPYDEAHLQFSGKYTNRRHLTLCAVKRRRPNFRRTYYQKLSSYKGEIWHSHKSRSHRKLQMGQTCNMDGEHQPCEQSFRVF